MPGAPDPGWDGFETGASAPSTSEVAFPGEQDSTWTYDDTAGQWYMHRYYDFMPDLNITEPDVRDEMDKVLGFAASELEGYMRV